MIIDGSKAVEMGQIYNAWAEELKKDHRGRARPSITAVL